MDEMFAKLAAPFPPERVSWRVGSTSADKKRGLALAYIDARDVMDRLDEVVGPSNWQARYPHANGKTVCEIDIWIEGRGWVTKADGAGDTDVEAEKGALSDAFKRAAVRWGIGRYLYDLDSPWVDLRQVGRSYAIADHELPRLRALLGGEDTNTAREDAGDASEKIAKAMISSFSLAETVQDLIDWAKDPNSKRAIADLPGHLANEVRRAWQQRKNELSRQTEDA